jgi:hypothetical protein
MADRIPDLLRPADKSPVDAHVAKVDGQGSGVGSGRETMTVREEEAEVSSAESEGSTHPDLRRSLLFISFVSQVTSLSSKVLRAAESSTSTLETTATSHLCIGLQSTLTSTYAAGS